MPNEGIESSLLTFLRQEFSVEIPSAETNLIESGILDSLMLVDLLHYAEQKFGIVVSVEDLEIENFITVSSMARFVAARSLQPGSGDNQS
jgi:methoxymalonate biosynthesis acyl carrier protein